MQEMTDTRDHWQTVYQNKAEQQTSWFRPHLDQSLGLIDGLRLHSDTPIIDVGAGRSTLVDDLLARGFTNISVLDISGDALRQARERVESAAAQRDHGPGAAVHWIASDVLGADLPSNHYGLWHDRAAFHFLTDAQDQASYVALARRCLREGGILVVSTFAADGPEKCSGLPVCRYDASSLAARFGDGFTRIADSREIHRTPFDTEQSFTTLVLRRRTD